MNALALNPAETVNILPAPIRKRAPKAEQRFNIVEFTNPRTGSTSWRVTGVKRDDGTPLTSRRVRENFKDEDSARVRQIELETEFLSGAAETTIQATKLEPEKLRLAEAAFLQLGEDWKRLLDAIAHWKSSDVRRTAANAPNLDDAFEQFTQWLDSPECDLADHTKVGYKIRVGMFANSTPNIRVSEITPATIREHLAKRAKPSGPEARVLGKTSLKNDRRAICRFLSWCVEKEWLAVNPAIEPRAKRGGKRTGKLPDIFTLAQCKALLHAAEKHREGMLAPYVAVCLFAGLRPDSEAERITWKQVNLKDRQISIEPWMTKTGIPRTIDISPILYAWLKKYEGVDFYPTGWRKNFDKVKNAAGIQKWIVDGMRHTAHSHFFRKCESYGRTAEFFGNSEDIVRRCYVNRVTSDDAKKFYAMKPSRAK